TSSGLVVTIEPPAGWIASLVSRLRDKSKDDLVVTDRSADQQGAPSRRNSIDLAVLPKRSQPGEGLASGHDPAARSNSARRCRTAGGRPACDLDHSIRGAGARLRSPGISQQDRPRP